MNSALILLGPSSVLTIALPAELVVKAARGRSDLGQSYG